VWLEASIEDLQKDKPYDESSPASPSDRDELAWYGGSYNVWEPADESVGGRPADWTEISPVLKSVGLPSLTGESDNSRIVESSLLRAIPYVFTRGVFGTIRDVLSDSSMLTDDRDEDADEHSGDRWTVFPTVGFYPFDEESNDSVDEGSDRLPPDGDDGEAIDGNSCRTSPAYTTIRTMVGVVGRVVVTVRLPDALCAARVDAEQWRTISAAKPLKVPRRFFPQNKVPRGREVAEAIGIHQAATVRAVANRVRDQLMSSQSLAKQLRRSDGRQSAKRRKLRKKVVSASKETDQLAEIVSQLDQRISRLLRRFGGEMKGAPPPAAELVPCEVEKGYRYALDEVKSLHREQRRTSQAVTDALSIYDQDKRERFQHVAAMLASLVLIPTLFASLFGVNFGFPAKDDTNGFWVFLGVIAAWLVEAYFLLKRAQKRDWYLSKGEYTFSAAVALITALVIVVPSIVLLK
jgi:CorA-like Mg2+ transporter protein